MYRAGSVEVSRRKDELEDELAVLKKQGAGCIKNSEHQALLSKYEEL